jgi:ParB family chromosome partitioning protein
VETILLPLAKLSEHKDNPRQIFEGVDELALSIKTQGIIHPLQVRSANGGYQILSGAKRYRAAKSLGLEQVPAQVRELGDEAALEFMVNANLQTNPTALEESESYKRLKELGYTVERMASATAQTSRYVYERLLLLNLIPPAKKLLASKKIQVGHAVVLSRLKKDEQARALDPNSGGVFQPEGMALGLDLGDEEDDEKKDPLAGFKTRTVRELEAWIKTHVRFPKIAKEVDQVLFPETRKTLDDASAQTIRECVAWGSVRSLVATIKPTLTA